MVQMLSWSDQIQQLVEEFTKLEPDVCLNEEVAFGSNAHLAGQLCNPKTSDRSEVKFRHINTKNTNLLFSHENGNGADTQCALGRHLFRPGEPFQHKNDLKDLSFNKEAHAENLAVNRQKIQETRITPQSGADKRSFYYPSGIEHITLAQVLTCASPMMHDMIKVEQQTAETDWQVVISAARPAARYLGVCEHMWQEACRKLGETTTATIIVIAERKGFDPSTFVNSYNGYLRGCLAKAERGELHLHKSIFGMLHRLKQ
ncbi:Replication protein C C-terminal region [Pseudovibrio denitrificans]|uniref:Replication protein C C-terminal region n=1 Tax=Pseudovibrio denitrificans TaxID=258256 RepID=A0A1I7DYU8_9HYPH|nr:replication initiation protein RepC [Pseudovibrio denitrificans]SFU16852.1 Replication protein C C-terminal region [Pseudovibrio denitrificans]